MPNFSKSNFNFNGKQYVRYSADRKRGGASWVFYDSVPANTTYNPTWPQAIKTDVVFNGIFFLSRIKENLIHVDFLRDLTPNEENCLETLYTNHVAPVPT